MKSTLPVGDTLTEPRWVRNVFQVVLERACFDAPMRIVDDQMVAPWIRERAVRPCHVVESAAPYLNHLTAAGELSWFEAALIERLAETP